MALKAEIGQVNWRRAYAPWTRFWRSNDSPWTLNMFGFTTSLSLPKWGFLISLCFQAAGWCGKFFFVLYQTTQTTIFDHIKAIHYTSEYNVEEAIWQSWDICVIWAFLRKRFAELSTLGFAKVKEAWLIFTFINLMWDYLITTEQHKCNVHEQSKCCMKYWLCAFSAYMKRIKAS